MLKALVTKEFDHLLLVCFHRYPDKVHAKTQTPRGRTVGQEEFNHILVPPPEGHVKRCPIFVVLAIYIGPSFEKQFYGFWMVALCSRVQRHLASLIPCIDVRALGNKEFDYSGAVFNDCTVQTRITFLILGVNFGIGSRAELQLRVPLRQRFDPDDGDVRSATGDLAIATKFHFYGWSTGGLGARLVVKLPNISESTGIATDETDVHLEVLGDFRLGPIQLLTNAGIAILGDPALPSSQNDKFIFGAALLLPLGEFELGVDFHGLVAGDGGAPDNWSALGGLSWHTGPVTLDGAAGLYAQDSEDSFLATVGISTTFGIH